MNLGSIYRHDNSCIRVFIFVFFSCHVMFKMLYRFWNVFSFIHIILTYLCIVHIIFGFISCFGYFFLIIFVSYLVLLDLIIYNKTNKVKTNCTFSKKKTLIKLKFPSSTVSIKKGLQNNAYPRKKLQSLIIYLMRGLYLF